MSSSGQGVRESQKRSRSACVFVPHSVSNRSGECSHRPLRDRTAVSGIDTFSAVFRNQSAKGNGPRVVRVCTPMRLAHSDHTPRVAPGGPTNTLIVGMPSARRTMCRSSRAKRGRGEYVEHRGMSTPYPRCGSPSARSVMMPTSIRLRLIAVEKRVSRGITVSSVRRRWSTRPVPPATPYRPITPGAAARRCSLRLSMTLPGSFTYSTASSSVGHIVAPRRCPR